MSPALPSLPSGYVTQSASRFHDVTGRFSYEFNRVYGVATPASERGPSRDLDEGLSHWSVTWPALSADGDERPAGRCLSFTQACALPGARLTFARFSSHLQMQAELPRLLRPGEAV